MSAERKEIEWLLSVSDHIVEFVPSHQKTKDGSTVEVQKTISILIPLHYLLITGILVAIYQLGNSLFMQVMITRQRADLLMSIPALRKLDAMLIVNTQSAPLDQYTIVL